MWSFEHKVITKASKESIWKLWSNVGEWNKWDKEIEYSNLSGLFQKGTKGILKPKGGPKTQFILISVEEFKSFSDRTRLPLCNLDFIHTIRETNKGLEICHRIEFSGLLTFLFSRVIGKNIQAGIPEAVANLIRLAEQS
jgi:hypothetical protein